MALVGPAHVPQGVSPVPCIGFSSINSVFLWTNL